MWLFLFGSKDYDDRLGDITMKCPDCKTRGAFSVEQERKKFTVYFIPTFQYSKKQFLVCPACRERFEVARELKPELDRRLASQKKQPSSVRRKQSQKLATGKSKGKAVASADGYYCSSCGGEVSEKMVYCPECGGKLK